MFPLFILGLAPPLAPNALPNIVRFVGRVYPSIVEFTENALLARLKGKYEIACFRLAMAICDGNIPLYVVIACQIKY